MQIFASKVANVCVWKFIYSSAWENAFSLPHFHVHGTTYLTHLNRKNEFKTASEEALQPIWRGNKTFREDGFPAQKEPFVQFFSPDWEPSPQPSNYHFATHLRQFDNISSPQKKRIRYVLSYTFPCAWPLKRLVENNMVKGFIDEAEENRWHPLDMFRLSRKSVGIIRL